MVLLTYQVRTRPEAGDETPKLSFASPLDTELRARETVSEMLATVGANVTVRSFDCKNLAD